MNEQLSAEELEQILDALKNHRSWEELGFIKAGNDEEIWVKPKGSQFLAAGKTGIIVLGISQNDATYRLGRWEEAKAASARLGKYDALADFASYIMEAVKAGDDHAPLWELTSAMAMMKDD